MVTSHFYYEEGDVSWACAGTAYHGWAWNMSSECLKSYWMQEGTGELIQPYFYGYQYDPWERPQFVEVTTTAYLCRCYAAYALPLPLHHATAYGRRRHLSHLPRHPPPFLLNYSVPRI